MHANSKLDDAEQMYARHQYYQAKNQLRIINENIAKTEVPEEELSLDESSDAINEGHMKYE